MKKNIFKFSGLLLTLSLLSSFLLACEQRTGFKFINNNNGGYWGEDFYDYDDYYDDYDDDYSYSYSYNYGSSNNGGTKSDNGGQAGFTNNGGTSSQTGDTVDYNNPYFDFTWNSTDHTASICFKSGMENHNPVIPITYVYEGENYRIIDDDKAPGFSYMMTVETITIQEGFEKIINGFCHDMNLVSIKLPSTLQRIHAAPFVNCTKLQKIEYNGTKAEWEAIKKDNGDSYNYGLPQDITIVCKDGNLTLAKDPDW